MWSKISKNFIGFGNVVLNLKNFVPIIISVVIVAIHLFVIRYSYLELVIIIVIVVLLLLLFFDFKKIYIIIIVSVLIVVVSDQTIIIINNDLIKS